MEYVIEAYFFSKVEFVYQFEGLNYLYITGIIKIIILKPNLQVRIEAINKLASFLYKYCLLSKASFKYKEVFIFVSYPQYAFSLLKYHEIKIVIIWNV